MADGWATFGKGIFVCIAVAGGIWLGRGGTLPQLSLPAQQGSSPQVAASLDQGPPPNYWAGPFVDSQHQYPPGAYPPAYGYQTDPRTSPALVSPGYTSVPAPPPMSVAISQPGNSSAIAPVELAAAHYAVGSTLAPALVSQNQSQNAAGVSFRITGITDLTNGVELNWKSTETVWLSSVNVRFHVEISGRSGTHSCQLFVVDQQGKANAQGTTKSINVAISEEKYDIDCIFSNSGTVIAAFLQLTLDNGAFIQTPPMQFRIANSTDSTSGAANAIKVFNNRYAAGSNLDSQTNVFGGYVRFEGSSALPNSSIRLLVADENRQVIAITPPQLINNSGAWSLVIRNSEMFPAFPGAIRRAFFVLEQNSVFTFVQTGKTFTLTGSSPADSLAPKITGIKIPPDTGNTIIASVIPTNAEKVAIQWRVPNPSGLPPDSTVVLMVNNVLVGNPQSLKASSGSFDLDLDQDLSYVVGIQIYQGDRLLGQSAPVTIRRRTRGPVPKNVSPDVLTPGGQANKVVLRFDPNSPLDPDHIPAEAFGLRLITNVNGPNELTTKTITPTYVDGQSVELNLGVLEPGQYQIVVKTTVKGQLIQDIYGNPLSTPAVGSDYAFPISKLVGEEPLPPGRGLAGITGPQVTYPEYTRPREYPEGFNPSDKVVTRVSRLYYYRDGHRVVQLLNRNAKSYNRQAVSQQEQLADNARRDAENITADRRFSERDAVRSAQRARAAESALIQAQQALAQAQAASQTAGNTLPAAERSIRDQQLVVSNRQADATAAETGLSNLNNQHPNYLSDLDAANAAVAQATQALTSATTEEAKAAAKSSLDTAKQTQQQQQQIAIQIATATARQNSTAAALAGAQSQLTAFTDQRDDLLRQQQQAGIRLENSRRLVDTAAGEVQAARQEEVRASDETAKLENREDQAFRTMFRREVAASTADPDTYAPGKPESDDPVEQVSLSVIDEGVIQLRSHLKGVNLARTQINQIDAPVGQVRVAIHTIQVNGEHGNRMEPVVARIGQYLEHSRFLTSQSAQMLRKAVTIVASRRAEEAYALCEEGLSSDRDVRYLHAFFGKDFIDELRELDSEFLRTGNKLLALHSMDSTSLAQALFLMALAKNDVRMEILTEFERLITCELPLDEMSHFEQSNTEFKFSPMFKKQKFQFLAHNARFTSLRGYFNAEIAGPDTLNPMQREFIRLAQIFKSRLVAEREIQQRVMERALIEERIGQNYLDELSKSRDKEKMAVEQLNEARRAARTQLGMVINATQPVISHVNLVTQQQEAIQSLSSSIAVSTINSSIMERQADVQNLLSLARGNVGDNTETLEGIERSLADIYSKVELKSTDPKTALAATFQAKQDAKSAFVAQFGLKKEIANIGTAASIDMVNTLNGIPSTPTLPSAICSFLLSPRTRSLLPALSSIEASHQNIMIDGKNYVVIINNNSGVWTVADQSIPVANELLKVLSEKARMIEFGVKSMG